MEPGKVVLCLAIKRKRLKKVTHAMVLKIQNAQLKKHDFLKEARLFKGRE